MENRVDKPWDDSLRTLVRTNPQAFIAWLLGEALFIRELPYKLKTWKQEVDALLLVLVAGQEMLLHIAQPGLLPLLPLTKGGASREVAERMFTDLEAAGRTDLMAIGGTILSLVFKRENPVELDWLNRRLHKMHDLLRESPFYQEILQEGREKGLEEGLEKGKLEGSRETLLKVVRARFPKMVRLTKRLIADIDDSETLEDLIVKVSMAQTLEEAQKYLLEADEDNSN